jgi:hypothetical protein
MEKGKPRKKYLRPQHLTGSFNTFTYSMEMGGVLCKACVHFGIRETGGVKLATLWMLLSRSSPI